MTETGTGMHLVGTKAQVIDLSTAPAQSMSLKVNGSRRLQHRRMSSGLIFFGSLTLALLILILERLVGMGWDYHPDSVTYATLSQYMVDDLSAIGGIRPYLNNGYYVLVAVLNENIIAVTCMNLILFSVSNVMIYNLHNRLDPYQVLGVVLPWLLLLNPYRLHLSTTMLKDTLIIFIFLISLYGARYLWLIALLLPFFRVAAIIYLLAHLKSRRAIYGIFIVLALIAFFPSIFFLIVAFVEQMNENEMNFRDFDSIPSFQEYGFVGVFLRAFVWPALFISGGFFFISPSLQYFPVAVGSMLIAAYCIRVRRKAVFFDFFCFSVMIMFAAIVTGFTSYLRYVTPVMTLMPLIVLYKESPNLINRVTKHRSARPGARGAQ